MHLTPQHIQWCEQELEQIVEQSQYLDGAAICTTDGLGIVVRLPASINPDHICAMSSSLFGIAAALQAESQMDGYKALLVDAQSGKIVITLFKLAGIELLLVQLGKAAATLGALNVTARGFSEKTAST
ncbi:roadblock/LC7 domain-containing protein [Paraherbaspirillum soli]|uniref:Roadblock/LC7 domain-containing protein n=1 Tax=Paraherbaspirillum soli TaxID=631222 RepID=A0ABW0M4U1_9BURK